MLLSAGSGGSSRVASGVMADILSGAFQGLPAYANQDFKCHRDLSALTAQWDGRLTAPWDWRCQAGIMLLFRAEPLLYLD